MEHMGREELEYEERKTAIRRRRAEQKRLARKKALYRGFVLFCIIAVLTLAVLSVTVFFPVKTITVSGKSVYQSKQIVSASGIKEGENLFITGRDAEEKIARNLPYIKEVNVKRKFPATITLEVTANKAAYCYKTKKGFLVCDSSDKLLEVSKDLPKELLQIIGSTAKNTETGTNVSYEKNDRQKLIMQIRDAIKETDLKIIMIDVSDPLEIYFNVEGRFGVTFGSSGNLNQKITHLAQMVKKIDPELKGNIDLSFWSAENPRGIFTQK